MQQHELMDVQKNEQHENNSCCRKAARCRDKKPYSTQDLRGSAGIHKGRRMGIVVRHDLQIRRGMPEVVDTTQNIKSCLCHKG